MHELDQFKQMVREMDPDLILHVTSDPQEYHVCRLCFMEWTIGKKEGVPAQTMTGGQLATQPYTFKTREQLVGHVQRQHLDVTMKE